MIKEVKINDILIESLRSVKVTITTPSNSRGNFIDPTFAARIEIEHSVTDVPTVDIFDLATNGNGKKNIFDKTTIQFESDDEMDNYSLEANKAYIQSWMLKNHSGYHEETRETFTLIVGELTYNVAGEVAKFTQRHKL